jgi:hypothetical protein
MTLPLRSRRIVPLTLMTMRGEVAAYVGNGEKIHTESFCVVSFQLPISNGFPFLQQNEA